MGKTQKITKEMKISEVIKKHPKTAFVFIDYDLHCVSCPMARGDDSETIEEAAKLHRIDLKKFLSDLNKTTNPVRKSSASSLITKRRRISNPVRDKSLNGANGVAKEDKTSFSSFAALG